MLKEAIVKEHYEGLGIKYTITLCSWVGEYSRGESIDEGRRRKTPISGSCQKTNFSSIEEELVYVVTTEIITQKGYISSAYDMNMECTRIKLFKVVIN